MPVSETQNNQVEETAARSQPRLLDPEHQSPESRRMNEANRLRENTRVLVIQCASVPAGTDGFIASKPLGRGVAVKSVALMSDLVSPLLYVRCGMSQGDVTNAETQALGDNFFMRSGVNQTPGMDDAVPMMVNGFGLGEVYFYVSEDSTRIYLQVMNRTADKVANVAALITCELSPESE